MRAKKRFGQNFLHDQGIIEQIVRAIGPSTSDHLVEIGPGQGALTAALLSYQPAQLDAIELDQDLYPQLLRLFASRPGFHLHEADALKFDYEKLYKNQPLRLVGNLPYNISTPLLFHLFRFNSCLEDMHFMLQKEVVDRLAAAPGHKDYGRLSIMAQYQCQVEPVIQVPPEAFTPKPKVNSTVVRLKPHPTPPFPAKNFQQLQVIVRQAFTQRRKTLRNVLKGWLDDELWNILQIDSQQRPESLGLEDYVKISNLLTERAGAHQEPRPQ